MPDYEWAGRQAVTRIAPWEIEEAEKALGRFIPHIQQVFKNLVL